MQIGHRTYNGADLRISQGPIDEDNCRLISHVHTMAEHRRKGDASKLMRNVCMEADENGTVLVLEPKAPEHDKPMDDIDLQLWYRRYGFERIQSEPVVLMMRAPR